MKLDVYAALSDLAYRCYQRHVRGLVLVHGEATVAESMTAALMTQLCRRRGDGLPVSGNDSSEDRNSDNNKDNNRDKRSRPTIYWVANDLPDSVPIATNDYCLQHLHQKKAVQLLGSDTHFVVINGFDAFDFNLLGRVINTLLGGGLLFLILPAKASPSSTNSIDRFYRLFDERAELPLDIPTLEIAAQEVAERGAIEAVPSSVSAESAIGCVKPTEQVINVESALPAVACTKTLTTQQRDIVDDLRSRLEGGACYAFVIGDRGRGKSTALGALLRELIANRRSVVVTASHRNQARQLLTEAGVSGEPNEACRYLPVDVLSESLVDLPDGTLLVIDEAASLSAALLQRLVDRFKQIIFVSTAQGYEGSASGFYSRFKRSLENNSAVNHESRLVDYRLTQPMRWSPACGLEAFFNQLLGLSFPQASDKTATTSPVNASELAARKVTVDELMASEPLLQQVFSLLVEAHYQTQPNDLQSLLDGEGHHLWVMQDGEQVLAVLLAFEEGDFDTERDTELVEQIVLGKRRPAGSLVPQKLANEMGCSDWCWSRSYRIVRIACKEAHRRLGMGTALVSELMTYASEQGAGFISSSFGLDAALLSFWWRNQFVPLFLGVKLDKASGANNLIVVKPISSACDRLIARQCARWQGDLPLLASRYLPNLDKRVLAELSSATVRDGHDKRRLQPDPIQQPNPSDVDRIQLKRFASGEISLASVFPALCRWRAERHGSFNALDVSAEKTIQVFVDYAPNWREITRQLGASGQKQALATLKSALSDSTVSGK